MNGIGVCTPFLLEASMGEMAKEIRKEGKKNVKLSESKGELTSKALKDKADFGWTDFSILLPGIGQTHRCNQKIDEDNPDETRLEFSQDALRAA